MQPFVTRRGPDPSIIVTSASSRSASTQPGQTAGEPGAATPGRPVNEDLTYSEVGWSSPHGALQ